MTEDISNYDKLWQEWLDTFPKNSRSNGNEEIEMLENDFERLDSTLQRQLIQAMLQVVLTQGRAHWLALPILKKKATIEHRRQLYELYESKLKSAKTPQDEWYLNELVDALSYETTDEFIDAITDLFLYRPYGVAWTRPSLDLLKTHPDLYLKGWTRFFQERPFEEWHDKGYIQYFLSEPEAIQVLKKYMMVNTPSTWEMFKQALLEWVAKPYWPSHEQKDKAKNIILS